MCIRDRSINEVFATLVHKEQGKDAVDYKLIHLPTTMGEGIGLSLIHI